MNLNKGSVSFCNDILHFIQLFAALVLIQEAAAGTVCTCHRTEYYTVTYQCGRPELCENGHPAELLGDGRDLLLEIPEPNPYGQTCYGLCQRDQSYLGTTSAWVAGPCSSCASTGKVTFTRVCTCLTKKTTQTKTEPCCDVASCRVNGGWSSWSPPSTCSVTCGTGVKTYSRSCTNPAPAHCGKVCSGSATKTESCRNPCACSGGWTSWSSGTCSRNCGGGTRRETRTCTKGEGCCAGKSERTVSCNICPCGGGWSSWTSGTCSKTCGEGSRTDTRRCLADASCCPGSSSRTVTCANPIPVNGGWSSWSIPSPCSATCGTGVKTYSRSCTNPAPAHCGNVCSGSATKSESCSNRCACSGGWTSWSSGPCSKTCGGGTRSETRTCTKGVGCCAGVSERTFDCNICPCGGGWSSWTSGTCSKTCGGGIRTDVRRCLADALCCPGNSHRTVSCAGNPCSVDGGWSSWSLPSACSVTCGTGVMTYSRSCTNPAPANGGDDCNGPTTKAESCSNPCACSGGWTPWSSGPCSRNCGGGTRREIRTCTKGEGCCAGESEKTVDCNFCPCSGGWSAWTLGPCSRTCGGGTRTSSRLCTTPDHPECCHGNATTIETCGNGECPVNGGWSPWFSSNCSSLLSGGEGFRTNVRLCNNPIPRHGGEYCKGMEWKNTTCFVCPVSGSWSTWSPGPCSRTCGGGTRISVRNCTTPDHPECCYGNSTITSTCDNRECPINGGWSTWLPGKCSTSACGGVGVQTDVRQCNNPIPRDGGEYCKGMEWKNATCFVCPCSGGWSDWSEQNCSEGDSTTVHRRTCTTPNHPECCVGKETREELCPVHGGWSQWFTGSCSSSPCGQEGWRMDRRLCNSPLPLHGGNACHGLGERNFSCYSCPCEGGWSAWSKGVCSKTFGGGLRVDSRTCTTPQHPECCHGSSVEAVPCATHACPKGSVVHGAWSAWNKGSCSVTCGGAGVQADWRVCNNPPPLNGGEYCSGNQTRTLPCYTCPCGGGWSPWVEGACSKTCGVGTRLDERQCSTPSHPECCPGCGLRQVECSTVPCPVDGGWTDWVEAVPCSVTCGGGGSRFLVRRCNNPVPAHGGKDCDGLSFRIDTTCGDCPCAASWSSWVSGACRGPCGQIGTAVASRKCNGPTECCPGERTRTESCATPPCS